MTNGSKEAIPFSIDISRMIELLASQIYPSPFALLRENVQNAFDAIMLRRHAGQVFEPAIDVVIEPTRIIVSDNGIGMSRQELRDHFWRAGSSSKNTDDARAAGVVGTFGIGAMANFGIADRLEVVSESANTPERTRCIAERATLSVTDDCIEFADQPVTDEPGTVVMATMPAGSSIDVTQAVAYIAEFVRFVELPVRVNGTIVSQTPLAQAVAELAVSWRWDGARVVLGPHITADVVLTGAGTGEVRVELSDIELNGEPIAGQMVLRQGVNALRTFRSRFGLAIASIPSTYQLGGVADFLILKPTAGREALTTESLAFLNLFAAPVDALISEHLANRPEANNSQAFINWTASHQRWDLCGQLRARIEPGDSATLSELAGASKSNPLLVYAGSDPATLKYASSERPLVQLARNAQRRQCEQNYLLQYSRAELLADEPKVLQRLQKAELTTAQLALVFRLAEILNSDYFLSANIDFGTISHGLPILVSAQTPVSIVLDPDASNVRVMLQIYEKEYGAFGHLAKDFVRNVIFPRVSQHVPSATRQGTEAFLKTLQRTRDVFEYERGDLENLTLLWTDYLEGKITLEQASVKSAAVRRSYQVLDPATTGRVRDVVPDVTEGEQFVNSTAGAAPDFGAMPPIQRTDISTDRKLLTIEEADPPLKGYRCFLALSKRIREERGEFFLQPHRTSVVWGGQKALFIFEHHSGEVGLYYDVQMSEPVASSPGGGSFETCTIVMKNQIFIPVPAPLQEAFMPEMGEVKRLEVRCDLLYIDAIR
ncbi:ATP-binding protein [Caballeronia sp. LZ065]|uniref:ATP-binding protein n=1 Tax=Caballeronia sp. LZ065 TaxID=3038571 RepID=UPI00285CE54C|nr:ATP-binding protein [Caballeronia sp. LZ065]MDR5778096.1 ATP-binding protein [Caballeronia sp. LZ065]